MRLPIASFVITASLLAAGAHSAHARVVPVANATQLAAAISSAQPGDEILLADGTYALTGATCQATGTANAPIVVRAQNPLAAKIQFNGLEGFKVTGPHWRFEDLDIRGVCANDSSCEHAFHVTGAADFFVMRRNRVIDFNAQLKVNATLGTNNTWLIPDDGLIEGNELGDSHARNTSNPVTKLNIDTGDRWIVRANYIHDHHKGGGDGVSYGAFMKSGGKGGLFERNLVICSKDDLTGGTRIGLSFGGGGTAPQFCAPAFDANTPCSVEHDGGTMRNNIIVNCSDVGVYLNRAKSTKILHNTLVVTAGVDFRFATTSGEARGNLLSGVIRSRDMATFTQSDNVSGVSQAQFTSWYVAPMVGDLRKKGDLSTILGKAPLLGAVTDDYCARARGAGPYDVGALQSSLGDCVTTRPPLGMTMTPADGGVSDAGNDATPAPTDGAPADGGSSIPDGVMAPDLTAGGTASTGCDLGGHRSGAGWLPILMLALAFGLLARRRARRA